MSGRCQHYHLIHSIVINQLINEPTFCTPHSTKECPIEHVIVLSSDSSLQDCVFSGYLWSHISEVVPRRHFSKYCSKLLASFEIYYTLVIIPIKKFKLCIRFKCHNRLRLKLTSENLQIPNLGLRRRHLNDCVINGWSWKIVAKEINEVINTAKHFFGYFI